MIHYLSTITVCTVDRCKIHNVRGFLTRSFDNKICWKILLKYYLLPNFHDVFLLLFKFRLKFLVEIDSAFTEYRASNSIERTFDISHFIDWHRTRIRERIRERWMICTRRFTRGPNIIAFSRCHLRCRGKTNLAIILEFAARNQ